MIQVQRKIVVNAALSKVTSLRRPLPRESDTGATWLAPIGTLFRLRCGFLN
jgi:hypothetical protein